jgi:hypothetical protein
MITIGIVAFSGYRASMVELDYDYDRFFPKADSSLKFFNKYSKKFGTDNDYLLIAFSVNEGSVFQADFLKKVKAFGDSLLEDSSITMVISPVHSLDYIKDAGFMGFQQVPYISSDFNSLKEDSAVIWSAPKLVGNFFSSDGKAVSMFVKTQDRLPKDPGLVLINKIKRLEKEIGFDEMHIGGRIIAQSYYIQVMIDELILFISTSLILIVLFLWIAFRNVWSIIVPCLTVTFSVVSTIAIMEMTGKDFDVLMVMLPTIIFVVGMSDLVHFLSKFYDELRNGMDKLSAIKKAWKEVGFATFLTSLTTAIGFFSLLTASIIPIQEFGIYAGVGVFVSYAFAFTFLPAAYLILPVPKTLLKNTLKRNWLIGLNSAFINTIRYRKWIVTIASVLLLVSLFGISQLKINVFLLDDLNEEDPLRADMEFFEKRFAGIRPFEMQIEALNGTQIYDYQNILSLTKVEEYLRHHYAEDGTGLMISPTDPIKYAYSVKHKNSPEYYMIPDREKRYENLKKLVSSNVTTSNNLGMGPLVTSDSTFGRLSAKISDLGSYRLKQENEKLLTFINDSIQNPNIKFTLTGTALLLDKNNQTLAQELIIGLLIALSMVAVIMAFIYRSFKLVLISLVPNILPLVFIGGVMYFIGFDIKISTALIYTLAFGIAVDDTIHMLSKLKLELNKGFGLMTAIRRSYVSTGKAIIVTTLILCGGFLTLLLSNFSSTFTMGLLVSITLFMAVIIDLTILPLMLIKLLGKRK